MKIRSAKHPWRLPATVIAFLLIATGTYFLWPYLTGNGKNNHNYQFATVQRGNIENVVTATGTLQPREYVDVGAQVSGQLEKIHVEVGSIVKEGDLLAEIDATVYLANVDESRAQLRNLQAQMKEREAKLTLAQVQYRRQQALLKEEATTQESFQTAEANLQSADAQLASLKAQIEQIESTLRAREANLLYARISSPMDGTVVSITARQGQTLNANQNAPIILRIADLDSMTVQTEVSEADVGKLKVGMQAYFTTLGGQGQRWYGRLEKIEPTPTITNNVVLYNAIFNVPNEDGKLMTQMTAQVFFVLAEAKDALVIPLSAVKPLASQAGGARRTPAPTAQALAGGTVQVRLPDGRLETRQVELGVSDRIQVEVLSGLQEGEQVVSGTLESAGRPASSSNTTRMPRL